jgi:hypothetical protein
MRFSDKDTIIYDTMGTIRYLLKLHSNAWDRIQWLEKKLDKAEQTMESIDGILFWERKRPKYFKL